MRAWLAIAVLVAGCSFDSSASVGAGQNPFDYQPSNFSPPSLVPSADVTFNCGVTRFDSTTLTFEDGTTCGGPLPQVTALDNVVFLAMSSLTISEGSRLKLIGDKPVVLAVFGDAEIVGDLDASADGRRPGPGGGDAARCASGNGAPGVAGADPLNAGGGGGGGHARRGKRGGDGADGQGAGGGGDEVGNDELIPLSVGCSGGPGGPSDVASGAPGGGGGGGVQVSAAGELVVAGIVTTAGGGGQGAMDGDGGGGGGSGGAVLLEGQSVTVVDTAALTANGGGGGEGGANLGGCAGPPNGDRCNAGPDGPDQFAAAVATASESSTGGDGGIGQTEDNNSQNGSDGTPGGNGGGGGGGGGGALGRVRINAMTSCMIDPGAVQSPAATGNGAAGCP